MAQNVRQQRQDLARRLRAEGHTWRDIADAVRNHWPELTARQAMRHAHQLTQGAVLDRWAATFPHARRPEERELGRWERWPGPGGIVPSWANLDRLAQIYQCSAADLLADISDYRPLDRVETPGVPDLSGIWNSQYSYPSGDEIVHSAEHQVVIRQRGNVLTAVSIPNPQGSRIRLDLTFAAPAATGTWEEWTSPHGRYRGASYHGGLQLLADPTGRTMTGAWVGFGRSFEVNTGTWELAWISPLPEGVGVAEATVPAAQ